MVEGRVSWRESKFVVVDIEGNGHRPPSVVELAIVDVVDGQIHGQPRSWLVRPPEPVTWQAKKVHGISNDDLKSAPSFDDVSSQIQGGLSDHVLVAHNAIVEQTVLRAHLPSWRPSGVVDTLRLARVERPELESHSLTKLVDSLALHEQLKDVGQGPHRAEYDAMAAAHLFLLLMEGYAGGNASLDRLYAVAGVPWKGKQQELF